jgi:hypothetical protein
LLLLGLMKVRVTRRALGLAAILVASRNVEAAALNVSPSQLLA